MNMIQKCEAHRTTAACLDVAEQEDSVTTDKEPKINTLKSKVE